MDNEDKRGYGDVRDFLEGEDVNNDDELKCQNEQIFDPYDPNNMVPILHPIVE